METLKINSLFWFNEVLALMGLLLWLMATFFTEALDVLTVFSPNDVESASSNEFTQLGWGLTGAILVGWSITLHAVNQREVTGIFSSENFLYYAVGSWFILDSITSIITGFYYNLVGNILFLIIALLAIRSSFKK